MEGNSLESYQSSSPVYIYKYAPVHHHCVIASLLPEISSYERVGEEIVVEDMHTRKKMMFDSVS